MNVREYPATPRPQESSQAPARIARPSTQAPLFRGQSQRADSLADMLSLDRLISRGIREDRASRLTLPAEKSPAQQMLDRAAAVLATTRRSW